MSKLSYMRESPVVSAATYYIRLSHEDMWGLIDVMSKNASSDSSITGKPENPQETLNVSNYYYSGFCAGEMSCSIIRATNYNPHGHYYYMVDFTVTNADTKLLREINQVMMKGRGNISPVKGAFNLKVRGKERVRIVLNFLERYPIIIGDLAKNRITLLTEAMNYLDSHRGGIAHEAKTEEMERLRQSLRLIKTKGIIETKYAFPSNSKQEVIGYFLAGVLDGEGSFGFKQNKSGDFLKKEPFFAMGMKDEKIILLLREFIGYGNVRYRKDGIYFLEINKKEVLLYACRLFIDQYPLRHKRQRERLQNVQRILNDHTLGFSLCSNQELLERI